MTKRQRLARKMARRFKGGASFAEALWQAKIYWVPKHSFIRYLQIDPRSGYPIIPWK
jgi:hypothetical protein